MPNTPVVSPTQAYEYLHRALQLLEEPRPPHPNSWIQSAEAIDNEGRYCNPESERAVAWCTIGVVMAVTHYDPHPEEAYKYVLSLLNMANPIAIANDSLPAVNDTHAFETVRRMFQKAMGLALKFGG